MRRWAVLALVAALPAGAACGNGFAAGDDGGDGALFDGEPDARSAPDAGGGGAPETSAPADRAAESSAPDVADDSDSSNGAFSPSQLAGLGVWLDDDKGVVMDPQQAGHVVTWLDQSGYSNDANATSPPEPAVDPKALNGHDGIVMGCKSAPFQIANAPALDWGLGDFTIVAVVRLSGDSDAIWQDPNAPAYISLTTAGGAYKLTIGGQAVTLTIPNPGGFDIVVARGQGMRLASGAASSTGPTTLTNVSPGSQGVFIGFCGGSSQMEIAELLAIGGPLADVDLGRLLTYLRTKFAL
jgi:hypothetical protein